MDKLGRIVIPNEIRKTLHFNAADPVEIHVENSSIVLSKHNLIKKFIATTFYEGIGNEYLYIYAAHEDEAFTKLFHYYLKKGERLGYWLNADGEPVADFDNNTGCFENHEDWDFSSSKKAL